MPMPRTNRCRWLPRYPHHLDISIQIHYPWGTKFYTECRLPILHKSKMRLGCWIFSVSFIWSRFNLNLQLNIHDWNDRICTCSSIAQIVQKHTKVMSNCDTTWVLNILLYLTVDTNWPIRSLSMGSVFQNMRNPFGDDSDIIINERSVKFSFQCTSILSNCSKNIIEKEGA